MKKLPKLARWILFTVVISIVPLLYTFLKMKTFSKPFNIEAVASHGELLLIAIVIGGGAIGELIGSRTKKRLVPKITCAGTCLVMIMMQTMWFADVASATEVSAKFDPAFVASGSLAFMILTLLASAGCVTLSEV